MNNFAKGLSKTKQSGKKRESIKRKEKSRLKKLKEEAWKLMSLYVRARDKECFTCGGQVQHAGHWRHGVCDYGEWNIHAQCLKCNYFLSGDGVKYTMKMIELYGLEKKRELRKGREVVPRPQEKG